jgi:predicted nucleic acid-binding protein
LRGVADARPLIHLSWIGRLDLLDRLLEEMLAARAVGEEVLAGRPDAPGLPALREAFRAERLRIREVRGDVDALMRAAGLERGESASILLVGESRADLLLSDDGRARDEADRRGLNLSGTIGVLRRARDSGLIEAVHPLLLELRARGFWLSEGLLERIETEERTGLSDGA